MRCLCTGEVVEYLAMVLFVYFLSPSITLLLYSEADDLPAQLFSLPRYPGMSAFFSWSRCYSSARNALGISLIIMNTNPIPSRLLLCIDQYYHPFLTLKPSCWWKKTSYDLLHIWQVYPTSFPYISAEPWKQLKDEIQSTHRPSYI